MLGDYTQRSGKWHMMDMEAIPLVFPKNKWFELWRRQQAILVQR